MDVSLVNTFVGTGTLILQIIIAIVLLVWFYSGNEGGLIKFINRHSIWITFILALAGMLLSLFYSDIIGYEPCKLCWLQRIFLYPQVFILGLALWKKDSKIVDYSILLSVIGLILSIYHKYVELGGHSALCATEAVSCSKIYVLEYGYITIPVMAMTSFVTMLLVMLIRKFGNK
jgi:disulfide bond formation protein DsbB